MSIYVPPLIGGPIVGSTSGSIIYADANGNFAQDNANLFWDATNHRLGLRTTSPITSLANTATSPTDSGGTGVISTGVAWTVNGAGYAAAFSNTTVGAGAAGLLVEAKQKWLTLTNTSGVDVFQVNNLGLLLGNSGVIYPAADSTTALQINKADGITNLVNYDTTNGRVGIQTPSPQRVFHCVGPDGVVPSFPSGAVGPKDLMLFENNSNANICLIAGSASVSGLRFLNSGGTDNVLILVDHSTGTFSVFTAGSAKVTMTSGGLFGIGAGLTPTHLLQLSTDDAAKPTTNTWTIVSDRRSKTQIQPYAVGSAVLRKLQARTFVYNGEFGSERGVRGVGFVADEGAVHAPEMFPRYDLSNGPPVYHYQGHNLPFMLLNGWQEHDTRLAAIEARLGI